MNTVTFLKEVIEVCQKRLIDPESGVMEWVYEAAKMQAEIDLMTEEKRQERKKQLMAELLVSSVS